MKSVGILGGGISGLSSAFFLLRNCKNAGLPVPRIKIFEAQDSFGGWMKTVRFGENSNDYFDLGPRTITTKSYAGTNVISMVSEIGLSDKVRPVTANSKTFKKRFIVINGRIHELPSSLKSLFFTEKPFKPFIIYLLKDFFKSKLQIDPDQDISIDEFMRKRFHDDIADYLINPMCIGITGGNSKLLSIKSVFPTIFQGEQTHGSVVKSMFLTKVDAFKDLRDDPLVKRSIEERWSVFSFENGIGTLSDRLAKYLQDQNVELCPKTFVKQLKFDDNSSKCTVDGESFDHVFSSLPAYGLSSILHQDYSELKNALLEIPFVDMAVVSFKFPAHVQLPDRLKGFGFLVPSHENSSILGVIFDSSIFEDNSTSKYTVMLGGYRFQQLFGSADKVSKQHLIDVSRKALERYLNFDQEPLETIVSVHSKCIPQYNLGHSKRIANIETLTSALPLSLIGSSYHGFSVPDCVYNAKLQADKFIENC